MNFTSLLCATFRGPRGAADRVFNPYRDADPALDRPGAVRDRRRNLETYLERVGPPRLVLLGEALGYQGGRFSGIAFTSERQLAGEDDRRLPWAGAPFRATSTRPDLWTEPSGSIVWGALGHHPQGVLLWNTFPWHPYGAQGLLSNRTPERRLLGDNLEVVERLLAAVAGARLAAVGRTAQAALAACGVVAPALRHPAHGGATMFRRQVAPLLLAARSGNPC